MQSLANWREAVALRDRPPRRLATPAQEAIDDGSDHPGEENDR
jgi:hypothetical protein